MEKLKMQTPNLVDKNVEQIGKIFPEVITETKDDTGNLVKGIDFDLLKQKLSSVLVEDENERYRLDWPGKKASLLKANTPIAKTLRPVIEESVDFEKTENLYIEGDNFEVLKILQESYLGKVKMIYIDPPYNTGNDFIYKDNYKKGSDEYDLEIGAINEEGGKLFKNTDSNGRFHSDWLSMMYERLAISRDLLKDDGIILISIDDNEFHNLKKICDEVFGEENFICELIWEKKTGASDAKTIAIITEIVLVYTKNVQYSDQIFKKNTESYDLNRYRYKDEYFAERGPYYIDNLDRGGLQYSDSLNYKIETEDGRFSFPNGRLEYINDGWIWKWGKEKVEWGKKNGFIVFKESANKVSGLGVYYKNYLNVDNEANSIARAAPKKNMIRGVLNANGAADLKSLFEGKIFDYPKPVDYIKIILDYSKNKEELILDYFSGSATTANAVMQLNAEDGGNRKFIMVQLPEKTDEDSEAFKAGYKTISEIGKERIRRAGKKIKKEFLEKYESGLKQIEKELEQQTLDGSEAIKEKKAELEAKIEHIDNLDIGFRVYRTDSSNMKDIFYHPTNLTQLQLSAFESNIKEDRTPEDLLTQVILDLGLELSLPIEKKEILGNNVFIVQENALVACFDDSIDFGIVDRIADLKPLKVVFKDASFKDDKDRVNVEERFKRLSPETIVSVI